MRFTDGARANEHDPRVLLMRAVRWQHQQIRILLREVAECPPRERARAFDSLRRYLAAHDATEHVLLTPALEKLDAALARRRRVEGKAVGELMRGLEAMDTDQPTFPERLAEFTRAAERRAQTEEHEELPRCLPTLPEEEARAHARAVLAVGEVAEDLAREDVQREWSYSGMFQLTRYRVTRRLESTG